MALSCFQAATLCQAAAGVKGPFSTLHRLRAGLDRALDSRSAAAISHYDQRPWCPAGGANSYTTAAFRHGNVTTGPHCAGPHA